MIITNDTATDIWQQKLLLKITQTEAMTVSLLTNIINTAAAAAPVESEYSLRAVSSVTGSHS